MKSDLFRYTIRHGQLIASGVGPLCRVPPGVGIERIRSALRARGCVSIKRRRTGGPVRQWRRQVVRAVAEAAALTRWALATK